MSVLIVVVCLVSVYNTWVLWNARAVLVTHAGLPDAGYEELRAVEVTTALADMGMWLALTVTWIALTEWLWRARVNCDHISDLEHRHSRGWTIGAWVAPFVNWWYPRQIVDDIWRASHPGPVADPRPSPLVRAWWLVFVGAQLLLLFPANQTFDEDTSTGYATTLAICTTVKTLLLIAAGALLIAVIHRITTWQSRTPLTRQETAAPQQSPPRPRSQSKPRQKSQR
ncbi:MAG: DUF4328 domain-containing protein [Actinomycetota bacterium]|nr:DUF4328 domain-containing protein [Actinomycetota bacterium]